MNFINSFKEYFQPSESYRNLEDYSPIERLPPEILTHILGYSYDPNQRRVCKVFCKITSQIDIDKLRKYNPSGQNEEESIYTYLCRIVPLILKNQDNVLEKKTDLIGLTIHNTIELIEEREELVEAMAIDVFCQDIQNDSTFYKYIPVEYVPVELTSPGEHLKVKERAKRWRDELASNEQVRKQQRLLVQGLCRLPKEIKYFKNLELLHIDYSALTFLPKEIGTLKNLKELDLSSSKLRELPESFYNLTKLENLYLCCNQLTRLSDAIENFSSLDDLDVSGNEELMTLPKNITKLRNLKQVNITATKIDPFSRVIRDLRGNGCWICCTSTTINYSGLFKIISYFFPDK